MTGDLGVATCGGRAFGFAEGLGMNVDKLRRFACLFLVGSLIWSSGCGVVGASCDLFTGLFCGDNSYCEFDVGGCGASGQVGVCTARPEVCAEIFAPVCGCDGETYGNACEAAAAGFSIRSQGTCPVAGESICGGIAGFVCAAGELCKFTDGSCGAADQSGYCIAIPNVCTTVVDEVCGCDEVTYSNECEAERAGVSIIRRGACDQRVCGGIAGLPCNDGEYCQTNPGECCCDFQGVCVVIPTTCTEESAPVCGCDGGNYDNACFAARAAASIDHEGVCAP